jgi:nucleotide-binding universal stress UspA family protein
MIGEALRLTLEPDVDQAGRELVEPVFEDARGLVAGHDVGIDTMIASGTPARRIVDHPDDFDVTVTGSHGGSLRSTLFVRNVAQTAENRAPIPTTVDR